MLSNIGSVTSHNKLQRNFGLKSKAPKSLYEHWYVFKELVNCKSIYSDWRCCVLYFSEAWLKCISSDPKWRALKEYLYKLAWTRYEFERNRIYHDITFSVIQKKRNLKPNPYLVDTAKHLFATSLGAVPGYAPAIDNSALPVDLLQKVYEEIYGLKKYWPTIMKAQHYNFEKDNFPIYYSLQYPATRIFSPKSRMASTNINQIRELEYIMDIFTSEILESTHLSDTIYETIARIIQFSYYHNINGPFEIIRKSSDLLSFDKRFEYNTDISSEFAADATFLRGCISISTINQNGCLKIN